MKKLSILPVFLFLTPLSLGLSFGAFPYDAGKETRDLEVSYSVGLINPGNSELKVALSSPESRDYNVTFEKKTLTLPPSPPTRNPSGSGWYHLGDGRYTEVTRARMDVDISRYRSSNTVEIPVTVRATGLDDSDSAVSGDVVYVREYSFRANVRDREPLERKKEGLWKQGSVGNDSQETPENRENGSSPGVEVSEDYKLGRVNKQVEEGETDSLTYLLVAGILSSLAYIYVVI